MEIHKKMKPTTIEDLAHNTTIDADELAQVIKDSFQDRTPVEIAKDTKISDFPEHLQGQVGLTVWAFSR